MKRRTRRAALRILAVAGAIGAGCFFASMILLNLLRPDVDPFKDYVSDLAQGRLGAFMTVSFFLHGAACTALGAGLALSIRRTPSHRLASWALVLGGLGVFLLGVFPTDPPGVRDRTMIGQVHLAIAGVAFVSLNAAFLTFTHAFHHDPVWDRFHRGSQVVAGVSLIGFAAYVVTGAFAFLAPGQPGLSMLGGLERIAIGTSLGWVLVASLVLWNLSSRMALPVRGPRVFMPAHG